MKSIDRAAVSSPRQRAGAPFAYQVARFDGRRVDSDAGGFDGLGRPVSSRTRFFVYCAVKPLLAIIAQQCAWDVGWSLQEPVGSVLGPGPVSSCSLETLLRHRDRVSRPDLVEAATIPATHREVAACRDGRNGPQADPMASHYSEAAAWFVISAWLRASTGAAPEDLARVLVLEPLGLQEHFLLDRPDGECAVNVSARHGIPVPLLNEANSGFSWRSNPGYGGWVSMEGLARMWHAIGTGGEGPLYHGEAVRREAFAGERRRDSSLRALRRFGAGTMLDFGSDYEIGSEYAVGHMGLAKMTAAWFEPQSGVATAVHIGFIGDPDLSLGRIHSAL